MIPLGMSDHNATAEVSFGHHQTVHIGLGIGMVDSQKKECGYAERFEVIH
jgi:hypothetical protein